MRIERVAANASPLIALFQSGQGELLPQLFDNIVVPESVWREVAGTKHEDLAAAGLPRHRGPRKRPFRYRRGQALECRRRRVSGSQRCAERTRLLRFGGRPRRPAMRQDTRCAYPWNRRSLNPCEASRTDHFGCSGQSEALGYRPLVV